MITLQIHYPTLAVQKACSFRREVVLGQHARSRQFRTFHILVRNAGITVAMDASSPPSATCCVINENGPVLPPNHTARDAARNSQGQPRVMGMLHTLNASHGATRICDIVCFARWGLITKLVLAINIRVPVVRISKSSGLGNISSKPSVLLSVPQTDVTRYGKPVKIHANITKINLSAQP